MVDRSFAASLSSICLFTLLVLSAANDDSECFGSTVFRPDDIDGWHEFKVDTGNCSQFRWEYEIEQPANSSDCVFIKFNSVNFCDDTTVDILDFADVNGIRRTARRFRRPTESPKSIGAIENAVGAGMLVIFEKRAAACDHPDSFSAIIFLDQSTRHRCPHPFLTATAKPKTVDLAWVKDDIDRIYHELDGRFPFHGCSLQINASEPGREVILEANTSYVGVNVYKTNVTDYWDSIGYEREGFEEWNTTEDSIMIYMEKMFPSLSDGDIEFVRITYSQEERKHCKCFDERMTVTLDQPIFLISPEETLGGPPCRRMECKFTVALEEGAPSAYTLQLRAGDDDHYHALDLINNTDGSLHSLEAAGSVYSPKKRELRFRYDSTEVEFRSQFNLTVAAVHLGERCRCPEVDEHAMYIVVKMSSGCRAIDCEWEMSPNRSDRYFDWTVLVRNLLGPGDNLRYCSGRRRNIDQCTHFTRNDDIHFFFITSHFIFVPRSRRPNEGTLWWHRACAEDDVECAGEAAFEIKHRFRKGCACPFAEDEEVEEGYQWNVSITPGEPQPYYLPRTLGSSCPHMRCAARFIAPLGHHIRVQLHTLDLNTAPDKLLFVDGDDVYAGEHIENLIGRRTVPDMGLEVEGTTQALSALFSIGDIRTHFSASMVGFNATVYAVPDEVRSDWSVVAVLLLASAVTASVLLAWRCLQWRRKRNSQHVGDLNK